MLHPVILTKARRSGKIIGLLSALAKLRRDGKPDRVCTSSDRSFNELPSTDGSGPDPLGKIR
jgi:hypothetical protein